MQYGHFDNEKREYVITRVDTPSSWTNYIGTENLTGVFNQTAGGYLFYKSAEYHRITRFRANAAPLDRPGHYIYLRDNETGDFWSVSWQPAAKPVKHYKTRHGLSYSVYECDYSEIAASQTLFIPRGTGVELWDAAIENKSGRPRDLSVFSYAEFSYHRIDGDNKNFQTTLYCAGADYKDGIIEEELHYEENAFQFFCSDFEPDGYEVSREKFTGLWRDEKEPEAVEKGVLNGAPRIGGNHCAALYKRFELPPDGKIRFCFMLGEGGREQGLQCKARFSEPSARDAAFADLARHWSQKLDSLQVKTPNANLDTMLNTWTFYQSDVNVMFSRFASFIEVGGRTGLGYRDTAQDAMCAVSGNPEKCKSRLIELLKALCHEGYGLHLFEPDWFEDDEAKLSRPVPAGKSAKDVNKPKLHSAEEACSDDALWLIPSVAEYLRETGDADFLQLKLPYADKPELIETVYTHLKRILSFSSRMTGKHGICLGLKADWNDCLNLGGGESAMVSYLHLWAISNMIEIAESFGWKEDGAAYRTIYAQLSELCGKVLWDGEWYLRGFTKKGRPIGTSSDAEGKIHLESNVWAVIAGGDSAERKTRAMDSIHKYLGTPYGLMLNAPAYTKVDDDVGFVTRVYPGLKENGAVFSHPNPWGWVAECVLGRGDKAMELYNQLCPAAYNDSAETRKAEPYSTCQFITGKAHPDFGEAHHPFMTGSGGWSYYAATHYILGIRPSFDRLIVDPCIPPEWDSFSVCRRFRGAVYRITVRNPAHVSRGVKRITLNGKDAPFIPILPEGAEAEIDVELGRS